MLRTGAMLLLFGVGIALPSCARTELPLASENTLSLELGGNHRPLGEALAAVDPGGGDTPGGELGGVELGGIEPLVVDDPVQPLVVPGGTRWVVLGKGDTVYDLAIEHLGAGGRWREILELNGWTERQAKRLDVGTSVKLPAR